MQGDVDRGMSSIGEDGALVKRKVNVGIAQDKRGHAARFEFLTKASRQRERDIFFGKLVAQRGTAIVASVRSTERSGSCSGLCVPP